MDELLEMKVVTEDWGQEKKTIKKLIEMGIIFIRHL